MSAERTSFRKLERHTSYKSLTATKVKPGILFYVCCCGSNVQIDAVLADICNEIHRGSNVVCKARLPVLAAKLDMHLICHHKEREKLNPSLK